MIAALFRCAQVLSVQTPHGAERAEVEERKRRGRGGLVQTRQDRRGVLSSGQKGDNLDT